MGKAKHNVGAFIGLLVASFVIALLLAKMNFVGVGVSIALGGLAILVIAFASDWGKKTFRLDWHKLGIGGFAALLVLGGFLNFTNPLSEFFGQNIQKVSADIGGGGIGQLPAQVGAGTKVCPDGSVVIETADCPSIATRITTTTATLTITAENLLNKSFDTLNPSGYYKDGESYRSLSFSSGSASIASLDPAASIEKVSVGTDATFYWKQIPDSSNNDVTIDRTTGKLQLKGLSPTISYKLVRVFTNSDLQAYSDGSGGVAKYGSLTNGTSNNQSVGTGGSLGFLLDFEAKSLYTGIRAPTVGHSVNTTAVNDVTMPGLTEVTCPTSLVSDTTSRVLWKCFDTGVAYMADKGSKAISGVEYGLKEWQGSVKYTSTLNPGVTGGCAGGTESHGDRVYIFDKDEDYRSPVGALYFLDPATTSTNLGSTNNPNIYICPT